MVSDKETIQPLIAPKLPFRESSYKRPKLIIPLGGKHRHTLVATLFNLIGKKIILK